MVASRWVNIAPFDRRCIEVRQFDIYLVVRRLNAGVKGTCCRVHDTTCLMSLISKDEMGSTVRTVQRFHMGCRSF